MWTGYEEGLENADNCTNILITENRGSSETQYTNLMILQFTKIYPWIIFKWRWLIVRLPRI